MHGLTSTSRLCSESFVLFVSFVVRQFCLSARVLTFDLLSIVTHSKRQRI